MFDFKIKICTDLFMKAQVYIISLLAVYSSAVRQHSWTERLAQVSPLQFGLLIWFKQNLNWNWNLNDNSSLSKSSVWYSLCKVWQVLAVYSYFFFAGSQNVIAQSCVVIDCNSTFPAFLTGKKRELAQPVDKGKNKCEHVISVDVINVSTAWVLQHW